RDDGLPGHEAGAVGDRDLGGPRVRVGHDHAEVEDLPVEWRVARVVGEGGREVLAADVRAERLGVRAVVLAVAAFTAGDLPVRAVAPEEPARSVLVADHRRRSVAAPRPGHAGDAAELGIAGLRALDGVLAALAVFAARVEHAAEAADDARPAREAGVD